MIDYTAFTDMIRDRVSTDELGRDYGLNPGRDGRCRCIFCDGDRKDTLRLYPGNRGFYCFRCHNRGDVISLYQKLVGCGFKEAVDGLNEQYGLNLPLKKADPDAMRKAKEESERRKRERAEKEEREKRLLTAWWDAADAVNEMERVKRELAPQTPTELPRQRFVMALRYLDELRDYRDRLFDELFRDNTTFCG